jgi:hypothetical protein
VYLLSDLARRLLPLPSEVLILHPNAFAPTSWEAEDQKRLFLPKLDWLPTSSVALPGADNVKATCLDALAWLQEREDLDTWELDFSSSYVLHAFDDEIPHIRGWDHQINVKYVLARQSNYARAVYPAIRHAVEAGIIPQDEIS